LENKKPTRRWVSLPYEGRVRVGFGKWRNPLLASPL